MTTTPLSYQSPPPAKPKVPAFIAFLVVLTGLVLLGHLGLSVGTRDSSPIWKAWPTAMTVFHVGAALAAIGLAGWSLRGLYAANSDPAQPISALGRYGALLGGIAAACAWNFDTSVTDAVPIQWLLRLSRFVLAVGLPLFTMIRLGKSPEARKRYGDNVAARVGDHLLSSLTRDGAGAVLIMIAALLIVLFNAALPSIKQFGFSFLYTSEWRANELPGEPILDEHGKKIIEDGEILRGPPKPPVFGALPVIYGTAISSIIALVIAIPLSFGAAIFLIRIAPELRPITVKAGVCGLLSVLVLPALWIRLSGNGNMLLVLAMVVLGIALAEVLVFASHKMIGTLKIGQPVPGSYELIAHALLAVIAGLFAGLFLKLSVGGSTVFGLAVSAAFLPIGRQFTAAVAFLIEFLAAVPSIAYGLWGMLILARFLQSDIEPLTISALAGFGIGVKDTPVGRDMLCGGLILGIMIVPIITAISRDVLRAVPSAQVEGTTALGATWWESSREMLVYSRSALFGAVMLGLARAAGETMAVTMVIGNNPQIKASLFAPAQTMASLLANEFGEASGGHFSALMYVAFILLLMSLAFNVVARYFVVGKGSRTAAAH